MTQPPDPDTIARCTAMLADRLGPDVVSTDVRARESASKDYAWLSPILTEDLPDSIADVVVRPRDAGEVPAVLDAVSRCRVPLTVRGRGTGNYGQAVPLQRGVVLDMSGCTAVREVADGLARVEAGVTFTQLEQRANEMGLEAPVMPSMLGSTIGGFLSGGNQGVGSIENGSIWDGWVRALEMVPCAIEPEPFVVSGTDVMPYLHSYGTAGVLVAATVRLVPRRERTVLFAAFDRFADAARCGMDLMTRLAVAPRALSLDDQALAATLPAHAGVDLGATMLRTAIALRDVDAAAALVAAHGGRVTAVDAGALSQLYGSVYNHATLRAKRADPRVCSVQVRGWALIDREAEVRAALPDVRLHLDGNAPRQHGVGYSGLLLASWIDRPTLEAGMQRLRELGVIVISPHTYVLGGHGNVERIREVVGTVDPDGLLNPGKLPALAAG
jgi:FAD/FMN-containing dehydrogenase